MPVTLKTTDHPGGRWKGDRQTSAEALFRRSCHKTIDNCKSLIQSSFSHTLSDSHVSPSDNGFVRAIINAYSDHHHLSIRPEDVWFSILNQFSFYVQAHSEELRSLFVAHEGQKKLIVKEGALNIHTADFGQLAVRLTEEIEKNVVDEELCDWIMPDFSTTTENDTMVAAILMLGTMQNYFSYRMALGCGIPSVTLLGERSDWVMLLEKLDKLPEFGPEPTQFSQLLRPILTRFVTCFDDPRSPVMRDFWNQCADMTPRRSGTRYLSGWVTAFCFWSDKGTLIYRASAEKQSKHDTEVLELDDARYPRIDTNSIPPGYSSVPVTVDDRGTKYNTTMVAGILGIHAQSSGLAVEGEKGKGLDAIEPVSGWVMYENIGK